MGAVGVGSSGRRLIVEIKILPKIVLRCAMIKLVAKKTFVSFRF